MKKERGIESRVELWAHWKDNERPPEKMGRFNTTEQAFEYAATLPYAKNPQVEFAVSSLKANLPSLIIEAKRRGLEVFGMHDGTWLYVDNRHYRSIEPWVIEHIERLEAAIDAMVIQRARRIHYRTHNDIPMDMPKKVEAVVLKALREK